jgi:hypothetical protein
MENTKTMTPKKSPLSFYALPEPLTPSEKKLEEKSARKL